MPSKAEEPNCMRVRRGRGRCASFQRTNSPSRQIQSVAVSFVDIALLGWQSAGTYREARRRAKLASGPPPVCSASSRRTRGHSTPAASAPRRRSNGARVQCTYRSRVPLTRARGPTPPTPSARAIRQAALYARCPSLRRIETGWLRLGPMSHWCRAGVAARREGDSDVDHPCAA